MQIGGNARKVIGDGNSSFTSLHRTDAHLNVPG